jgi:hypothetical protein
MNQKQIAYMVNGAVSSAWRRLAGSKTFWVVMVFILTAGDRWNRGEISGAVFFQMVQIGVIGILIRAALTKSELAANAANPGVKAVEAVERERKFPTEAAGALGCMIATGALITLTACASLPHCPSSRIQISSIPNSAATSKLFSSR